MKIEEKKKALAGPENQSLWITPSMRIALLANPENIHVRRWVQFLAGRGHELLMVVDPHVVDPGAWLDPEQIRWVRPDWGLLSNVVAFRLTPKPHGNSLWKGMQYRKLVREFAPDVVHGFEAYYSGAALAACSEFPTVLTPWGKDVHEDAFRGLLWGWIVRRGLAAADRISTNDDTLPDWLEENLAVPREKVRAFSWGTDLGVFHRREGMELEKWRQDLDLPEGARIVLSPRKFDPYWGAEAIIELIPATLVRVPNAVFLVLTGAGDKAFRERMKARSEVLGVGHAIRWIDRWLDGVAMSELYSLAEIFISIPKADLLAMTLIEGLACGCFPVAADLPAYRKHLGKQTVLGTNAVLLDEATMLSPELLGQAVSEILQQSERLIAARVFNMDRMARMEDASVNMLEMEQVYGEAIEVRSEAGRGE